MRLSISLNGSAPITASLAGPGYLSAHLTMADRPKENDHSRTVRAVAIETIEKETIYMKWPQLNLQVGDVVEVRILPEGEGDAPKERKTSSEAPFNLLSSMELAKEVVHAVSEFEKKLMQLLERAKETEPAEDCKRFQRACGSGPTQTIPLLSGSPAIDAGNPSGCTDGHGNLLKTDQRGAPRPDLEDTGGCDMGAYESQSD